MDGCPCRTQQQQRSDSEGSVGGTLIDGWVMVHCERGRCATSVWLQSWHAERGNKRNKKVDALHCGAGRAASRRGERERGVGAAAV